MVYSFAQKQYIYATTALPIRIKRTNQRTMAGDDIFMSIEAI